MQTSSRLYHCLLCHAQVIICHQCDRGNRYCANGCSQKARNASLTRASKKYQESRIGQFNNAARQLRFRQQKKLKVTHQSSPLIAINDVLKAQRKGRKTVIPPPKHSHIMVCHHSGPTLTQ